MRYKEFAIEALKPSEYRHLVKGWDKTKYADLFGGKYRIYIPLESTSLAAQSTQTVKVNPRVSQEVEKSGYKIDDYIKGIASKTENGRVRQIKIGKLLSPATAQVFANDPSRQASRKTNQIVVISRHPYDIAGMSTDRGWTSCMNLRDESNNKRFVPLDIKAGTIIAYLIDANDKNIKHPQSRMLIKPFVNILGSHEVALGIENKIYGDAPGTFSKTVDEWVERINDSRKLDGIFELDPRLYHDIEHNDDEDENEPARPLIATGDIDKYATMMNYPLYYAEKYKPTDEATQKILVKIDPTTIQYMKKPSMAVQFLAVNKNPKMIKYVKRKYRDMIINPEYYAQMSSDEETQKTLVSFSPETIQYMENPSPEVQLIAMKLDPSVFKYIKNPTPKVQKLYNN
jgi:hypothetical protein